MGKVGQRRWRLEKRVRTGEGKVAPFPNWKLWIRQWRREWKGEGEGWEVGLGRPGYRHLILFSTVSTERSVPLFAD